MINKKTITFFLVLASLQFSWGKDYEVQTLSKHNGESMVFLPTFLKINAGDSVKFVPTDKGHTSQSVFTPKEARTWKGKTNNEVSVSFEHEGVYIFECQNHGIMGMAGIIQVGKAKNLKDAKEFYEKFKTKFIMNESRLDPIIDKIQ